MKLDIKQKLAGAKDFAKKHKTAILGTVTVVGATALVVFIYKDHKAALARRAELEAAGKKILSTFGNSETIEGSGPIWDKLRELFTENPIADVDIWMAEKVVDGQTSIGFITDGPLEVLEF